MKPKFIVNPNQIKKSQPLNIENKKVFKAIDNLEKRKEIIFESALRSSAKPPIKGPITRSKIKWRGIRMIKQFPYVWLDQRGKRISTKINVGIEISFVPQE